VVTGGGVRVTVALSRLGLLVAHASGLLDPTGCVMARILRIRPAEVHGGRFVVTPSPGHRVAERERRC
jgi:hypothetical protein